MVEKIKKYSVEMCNCWLGEHMETVECSDGDFYKVEDVDAILNRVQQLNDEIDDLSNWIVSHDYMCSDEWIVNKLRKLSANFSRVC